MSIIKIMSCKTIVITGLLFLTFIQSAISAEYKGFLSYPEAIDLSSPTTGVVKQVVAPNRFYQQSHKLLSFDSSIVKSQIKSLEIELLLQKKILTEARREFDRSEELYEGTMLSDHELKLAEIALLKERSQLQKLKSNLLEKHWQLKHYQLKAPFDGFVVAVSAVLNQYIVNRFKTKTLLKFVVAKDILIDLKLNRQLNDNLISLKQGDSLIIEAAYKASFISIEEHMSSNSLIIHLKLDGLSSRELKLPKNGAYVSFAIETSK